MRRLFFSVLLVVSSFAFFSAWNVQDASASSHETLCFCRITNLEVLGNIDDEDRIFCPNETSMTKIPSSGDKEAQCRAKCLQLGQTFVKASDKDPDEYANLNEMIKEEPDICIFSKNVEAQIGGWSEAYGNCKLPLNSIGKTTFPNYCTFCFCNIKAGPNIPAACVGKSSMVKVTSYSEGCSDLCVKLGYENGSSAASYGDKCDYKLSNNCSEPSNLIGGCKAQLDAQKTEQDRLDKLTAKGEWLKGMGTVLSLPLPLSDIKVEGVIGRVLNAVLGIVGAIALLMFVWGGFQYMIGSGSISGTGPDAKKIGQAKQTILWATLGLLAIFSSYAVLNLIIQTFSKT